MPYGYLNFKLSVSSIFSSRLILVVVINKLTYINSKTKEIPVHDGVITCPPYWNIEKYDGNGLDKVKTWDKFLNEYQYIWQRVIEKGLPNTVYCVVVADFRCKKHFYDFTFQTEKIFQAHGLIPYDKVILSSKKTTPYRNIAQARKFGYTMKVHQTLLVYKKTT